MTNWLFNFVLETATETEAEELMQEIIDFAESHYCKVNGGHADQENMLIVEQQEASDVQGS